MPVVIEATVEGEKQVSRRLITISDGIDNFDEPFNEIGDQLLQTIDMNFGSRGALFGTWPPRKDSNPWPLLEKTGTMRGSFSKTNFGDYLLITNSVAYFPYHQSRAARTVLPRRVMMKIDQERKQFIQKAFQKHIQNLVRSSANAGV